MSTIVEQLRDLRFFGPEHFELLRQAADRIAELERKLTAAQAVSDEKYMEVISLRAELEARTPAATADTELAEYNTGDTDLNALLYLTDDMARFGGNQDSGEAWMMSLGAVIAKLTPAAPVVAEGLDALSLIKLWKQAEAQATNTMPAPFQFARLLLAAHPVAGSPIPVPGLGSLTNEDDGVLTLRFKDEDTAQAFMNKYSPTVDSRDMPNVAGSPAEAEPLTQQQLSDYRARIIAETVEKFASTPSPMSATADGLDEAKALAQFRSNLDAKYGAEPMPASESPIGAGDPMAFFADFCDREGYPSDGEMDAPLRASFYEGIRYCAVHTPTAAPVPASKAASVLNRAIDCLEILDKRPRPMCRDCADSDGTCPNGGLECDMRKLISDCRAILAAPAAPTDAKALTATHGPLHLTNRKTADIAGRGYNIVGYVLRREDGEEVCISAESAVRWLPQAHYWRLMHEQDGSLFATTAAQSVRDALEQAMSIVAKMTVIPGDLMGSPSKEMLRIAEKGVLINNDIRALIQSPQDGGPK